MIPVPSLIFIGQNGKPLEMVGGVISISVIKTAIDGALIKSGKKVPNLSSAFINAEQNDASALNVTQPCASNSSNYSSSDEVSALSMNNTATNLSEDIKPETSATAELIPDCNDVVTPNADNDDVVNQQLTTAVSFIIYVINTLNYISALFQKLKCVCRRKLSVHEN